MWEILIKLNKQLVQTKIYESNLWIEIKKLIRWINIIENESWPKFKPTLRQQCWKSY